MKKNYKMIISYDGTRYYGWEHQPNRETIQGKLEKVLFRMCEEKVPITELKLNGAGRTDAGVHARAMAANIFLDVDMTPLVGKTYQYVCYAGEVKTIFDRKYVTPLEQMPDVAAMQEAAGYLKGKHDFASFCTNPKMKKSTVRIVDQIDVSTRKGYIYFTFHGTGFLQNMVRVLVGTLLEVGYGKMEPTQVIDIMEKKDRRLAGPTAPAQGLTLIKVDYD